MRSAIIIMDSDVDYASRLCEYMNSRNYIELKTLVCSTQQEYIQLHNEYNIQVLLVDEESYKNLPHEYRPEHIFVLLEERLCFIESDTKVNAVLKYTNAQILIKKVMDDLDLSMSTIHSVNKETEIIGVFSPISRSGKTVFAGAFGLENSKTEKTLLITFDEYRGMFSSCDSKDLSDIMYYYKQGKYSWEHLGKAVCSAKSLDYIAPVRYPEDLKELSVSELRDMLSVIAGAGQYTRIIVDFGKLGKHCTELLSICSKIFMPIMYDFISKQKLEEFDEYLHYVGRENLKDRIIKINVPFYKMKSQYNLYSLETTEVAMLARECIGAKHENE